METKSAAEVLKREEYGNLLDQVGRENTMSELSHELVMNPELCVKICGDLRKAQHTISELKEKLLSLRVNRELAYNFSTIRWDMNKYYLLQCDCSWQNLDYDLSHAISKLEMCHGLLVRKEQFTVKDIVYMVQTLDEVSDDFDKKIEQLEAAYGI